jgi:hypothetical protein
MLYYFEVIYLQTVQMDVTGVVSLYVGGRWMELTHDCIPSRLLYIRPY